MLAEEKQELEPLQSADNGTQDTVKTVTGEPDAVKVSEQANQEDSPGAASQDKIQSKKRGLENGDTETPLAKKQVSAPKDTEEIVETEEGKAEEAETHSSKEDTTDDTKEAAKEATEENTKESSQEMNTKENSQEPKEKPKFVFGSTASFSSAPLFSVFTDRKNVFDTVEAKESAETTSKPVFGGGSAFGNAFQKALTKKSIFDADTGDSADSSTEDKQETKDSVYQKVHLEKKEITTGEEQETTLFSVKSKLYSLDLTNVKEGWKERGIGVIRLNQSKELKKYRLLMRADAILKVILNVPVTPKLEIFKGMQSSLNGEKFLRFNFIENDEPVQFALKFGHADSCTKLYNMVKELTSS